MKKTHEFESCLFCKNDIGFKKADEIGWPDKCRQCKEIGLNKYSNYEKHWIKYIYVNTKWFISRRKYKIRYFISGFIIGLIVSCVCYF